MTLSAGTRLGPYEIEALVGAGGMGEVYRATDTHLARQVAIKVLPQSVAADAERLARFDREAKTLAALNHPNIAAIYGLERSGGTNALVMELVEGPTLADLIAERSIPVEEALPIARQIADALEAAHEQGIIHRDLKPANVKLRPDGAVKVLDFGLAKAMEGSGGSGRSGGSGQNGLLNSPTITSPAMTAAGMILGTAAYMSPEQARGKPADRRADIWAFGVVLYEMLTGGRAFGGDEITDTLAFIITKEPDWSALPATTPAAVRRLIRRCLEKDRKRRLADIADARLEIEEAISGPVDGPATAPVAQSPTAGAKSKSVRYAWLAAGLLLVTTFVLAGVVVSLRRPPAPAPVARFTVAPPPEMFFHLPGRGVSGSFGFNSGTVSPDGRTLAITLIDAAGKLLLWVRPVDSLVARPLAGTEGATQPFWSPDSRFLGFFADNKLRRIDITGGPPSTLCDWVGPPRGGTWNRDGTIIFAPGAGSLLRVSAAGGAPSPATTLQEGQAAHRRPIFLPDGRHFLYRVVGKSGASPASPASSADIVVGALDSTVTTPLVSADSQALYSPPGYLLFVRQGTLLAQPFDAERLQLTGEPFPIAEGVANDAANGLAAFSASDNGILTFRTGDTVGAAGVAAIRLDWVDRQGKEIGALGSVDAYRGMDISPDDAQVAFHRHDDDGGDVWLLDVKRGTKTRLTFNPAQDNGSPVWSSDGRRIVFASRRNASWGLYHKPFDDGGTADELLLETKVVVSPTSWSADGKYLVYTVPNPRTGADIWLLPLTGDRKPVPFAQEPFVETGGRVSPDGRWIAYQSNETGRMEVYVRPFPSGAGKRTISTSAGVQPRWRRDGKELFYVDVDAAALQQYRFMSVDVNGAGPTFEAGVPKLLFTTPMISPLTANDGIPFTTFDVSSDGQRFLITRRPTAPAAASQAPEAITVVINWVEAIRK